MIRRFLHSISAAEAGQTTSEYVAMTAAAVSIAIGVVWLVLGSALTDAIVAIGASISAGVG
jgi:hypothetical protein